MECCHRQSLRDGLQSRISAKTSSEESCLCRRRNLRQGLSQLRTSPNHQGLFSMDAASPLIAFMIVFWSFCIVWSVFPNGFFYFCVWLFRDGFDWLVDYGWFELGMLMKVGLGLIDKVRIKWFSVSDFYNWLRDILCCFSLFVDCLNLGWGFILFYYCSYILFQLVWYSDSVLFYLMSLNWHECKVLIDWSCT